MNPLWLEEGGNKSGDNSAGHEPSVIAGVDSDRVPGNRNIGPKLYLPRLQLERPTEAKCVGHRLVDSFNPTGYKVVHEDDLMGYHCHTTRMDTYYKKRLPVTNTRLRLVFFLYFSLLLIVSWHPLGSITSIHCVYYLLIRSACENNEPKAVIET